MTFEKNLWFFRFVQFSTIGMLACATGLLGCATEDVGSPRSTTKIAGDVSTGSGASDKAVGETSLGPADGFCGTVEQGYDEDGARIVAGEQYNYARMNYKLATYPDLAAAIGLTEVSDCAAARLFVAGYNQFKASHPDFTEEMPPITASPPDISSEAQQADQNVDEVTKIFGGNLIPAADYDINTMGLQAAKTQSQIPKGYLCSAVRLGGPFLLTSAHCVPTPTGIDDYVTYEIWIRRTTSKNSDFFRDTKGKLRFWALSQQSPNYVGWGDYNNDLALIYIPVSEQWKMLAKSDERAAFAADGVRIGTKTPILGLPQELRSWGPRTGTSVDPGVTTWKPNTNPSAVAIDFIDGSMQAWRSAAGSITMCDSDSGSGAYHDYSYLDGIFSMAAGVPPVMTDGCMSAGTVGIWTAVYDNDTFWWLMNFYITSGIQFKPNNKRMYYCGFVPGIADGGAFDPENSTAYVSCSKYFDDPE